MKRLIIAAATLLPLAAHAQSAPPNPPQFCISPNLAQTLAATLQQDATLLTLLTEAAQEPQRQQAAIAQAVAKQKAEDAAVAAAAPPPVAPAAATTPAAPAEAPVAPAHGWHPGPGQLPKISIPTPPPEVKKP